MRRYSTVRDGTIREGTVREGKSKRRYEQEKVRRGTRRYGKIRYSFKTAQVDNKRSLQKINDERSIGRGYESLRIRRGRMSLELDSIFTILNPFKDNASIIVIQWLPNSSTQARFILDS